MWTSTSTLPRTSTFAARAPPCWPPTCGCARVGCMTASIQRHDRTKQAVSRALTATLPKSKLAVSVLRNFFSSLCTA